MRTPLHPEQSWKRRVVAETNRTVLHYYDSLRIYI